MIVIPAVYTFASFRYQTFWLKSQANQGADAVSEIIYSHPESWEFQHHRLRDLVERTLTKSSQVHYQIINSNSEVLLESGKKPKTPNHSETAILSDGEKQAGKIIVTISLWSLIIELLVVGLIGVILSIAIYLTLRLLPFAALSKTTQSLYQSNKDKEKALKEQKRISEQMRFQSLHDSLTGLPNRKKFIQTLHSLIIEHTLANKNIWVIIIDLDRFKEINDALGHFVGDEVLIEIANRLTSCVQQDTLVARLGGDEYALVMPDREQSSLELTLTDIMTNLKSHITTQGLHLSVDASLGIAEFPHHGDTQEDLMRHADIAMYHAKSSGKDWAYYDQELNASTPNRLKLIAELRHALDNDLLHLNFQPKISIKDDRVIGLEVLARWEHPEYGYISPDVFIPIAEQTSMIKTLTTWVIKSSIQALINLHTAGHDDLNIAINISARNLQDEQFSTEIKQHLDNKNISANNVTLEITETSIMHDPEQSQIIVKRLSDLGFTIAIDDFGTGYSSLSYLKKLAANQVKIDRSFVKNLNSDNNDYVIVKSTVKLAHSLGLEVVAEGVEDVDTSKALKSMKCDFAQGYYYCKPIEYDELKSWLLSR